ncbi:MAG: hypothetical protein PHR90_10010 [Sphaerochaetaceae bacterium]|nr:hypothetical protein [Sphaerochaetaceae bacterium]
MKESYMRSLMIMVVFLLAANFHAGATLTADPSWYDIRFVNLPVTGTNLYDNSADLYGMNRENILFSRILTALKIVPPTGYGDLKLRFNAPGGIFRFYKLNTPSSYADATLRMRHESLPVQTVMPLMEYPITAGLPGAEPTATELFMDISFNPDNEGQQWRGNYYLPLEVEVLDSDGYVVRQKILHLLWHYRNKESSAPPITTVVVDQYPAAQSIPFIYPFQSGQPVIKVGSVSFRSNESADRYRLRVSPVGQPTFQFNHSNPNLSGAIKYRVTIPGRAVSSYVQAFECDFDYKGSSGNWHDFLEIGIRDINYDNYRGVAGDYASTIRLDVVSF